MLVPVSKKNMGSEDVPNRGCAGAAARECVERMLVPGATTSGLIRFSCVGPRQLNAAIPDALFAIGSDFSGFTGKELGRTSPYVTNVALILGRRLSLAPTEMHFLAANGEPTELASTTPLLLASMPSLPAAKQMTRSWRFQTMSSISVALASYGRPGCVEPHEFVCTRALLFVYGGVKRSCRSAGIPPSPPPESSSDCTTSVG